ncbi:MAG TPA: hypothetical protein VJ797_15555 [Burkholderiales bacterium]|nr:hypothetical protein [Burkholderiales bacterium]
MQVKLRTILAGPTLSGGPGDTVTVDNETGAALVAGGYAVAVDPVKASPVAAARRETATRPPEETAAAGSKSAAPGKGK